MCLSHSNIETWVWKFDMKRSVGALLNWMKETAVGETQFLLRVAFPLLQIASRLVCPSTVQWENFDGKIYQNNCKAFKWYPTKQPILHCEKHSDNITKKYTSKNQMKVWNNPFINCKFPQCVGLSFHCALGKIIHYIMTDIITRLIAKHCHPAAKLCCIQYC